MIKSGDLERAQELVAQFNEISHRLQLLENRDRGWVEGLLISVGSEPIFGNDESWPTATAIEFSEAYYDAGAKIAAGVKEYLDVELSRIRSVLMALGVELETSGK